MTLSADDFIPRAPTPPPSGAARRVAPMTAEEDYPKKMTAQKKAQEGKAPAPQKRIGRPPKVAKEGRCFALWNDGSIELSTDRCKGTLSADEARSLLEYVERLRGNL